MAIEGDERWSYVGNRASKNWVWLALDVASRRIVGYSVGQRGRKGSTKIMAIITARVRFATRIIGKLIEEFCLELTIESVGKIPVRLIILKDLTTRYVKEFLV
jgi:transposase InsO family protein